MNQTAPRQQPQAQQRKPAEPVFDPNAGLLDDVIAKTIDRLDLFAGKYAKELDDPGMTAFRRAAMTAIAIQRLRALITEPVLALLRELMNTPLGFKTDRNPKSKDATPYSDEIMRDCAIEALLRGVLWTGNEFNIIAGQCYITREGYTRKLQEVPGLTNLVVSPGIPRVDKESGRTVVRFAASWTYKGVSDSLKDHEGKPGRVFAITVNNGSGPDQIVGKAHRKGFKAIFDQIHGSSHNDRDDSDIEELIGNAAGVISDAQESALNEAIAEHEASAMLISTHYGLAHGQRLLAAEYESCMAKIKAGDFSAPRGMNAGLAEGELPGDGDGMGDLAEYTAEEVEVVVNDPSVYRRFGVKRAADLTQEQRRQIMDEAAQVA